MEYTEYAVRLTFQFPAWDERDGIVFYITSSSKSAAIKSARRQAYNDGHLARGKGRTTFKAVCVTEPR